MTVTVSVLMNCYNGEKYLAEAIESIIGQTFEDWELIFWDNCSTDRSAEIALSYDDSRIKYLRATEHSTLGVGRYNASPYLVGEFIAVLDADDIWVADKLEKQLPLFNDPDVGIVISDTNFFNDQKSKPLYGSEFPTSGCVTGELLNNYFVSLETVVMRKSYIDRLSIGFDPDFSFLADFDLVMRLSAICKLEICREVLGGWRVHGSSDSWLSPISFSNEMKKWIVKQRKYNSQFVQQYSSEFQKLEVQTHQMSGMYLIANGDAAQARQEISSAGYFSWKSFALLLLSILPGGRGVVRYREKRKLDLR